MVKIDDSSLLGIETDGYEKEREVALRQDVRATKGPKVAYHRYTLRHTTKR